MSIKAKKFLQNMIYPFQKEKLLQALLQQRMLVTRCQIFKICSAILNEEISDANPCDMCDQEGALFMMFVEMCDLVCQME